MLKKVQYKGYRTEWIEVPAAEAPKFGLFRSVRVSPYADVSLGDYDSTESLKQSFSFSGERLLLPWLTINDGTGHHVESVELEFRYSQGFVTGVTWKANYVDATTSKPDFIELHYHWHEVVESDPALAINVLLFLSLLISWIVAVVVLLEWDRKATSSNIGNSSSSSISMTSGGPAAVPMRKSGSPYASSSPSARQSLHTSSWEANDSHMS